MSPNRNNRQEGEAGLRYLPLAIDMAGRRCLVVGGGRVGARKVSTLVAAGAKVIVAAPRISDPVRRLVDAGRVQWQQAEYDSAMLAGCILVVAATDDRDLNARIASEAEALGILSCNVSAGNRTRVIFPAVYAGDAVTVAVHTDGRDCRLSQRVRNDIAAWLPQRKDAGPG